MITYMIFKYMHDLDCETMNCDVL